MALHDYEDVLKSYIHDDDKLVTYKWLSKELAIHVNIAKDILKQYWEKYKNEENIIAIFLLIGQLRDRSIRVEVVKESNLKIAKEKFMKVDCEHLYSLQKSLEDVELLAFAGEGDLHYSAIKCNEDYVRNDEEIENLRYVGNVKKEENKSISSNKITNQVSQKPELKKIEFIKEKSINEVNNGNDIQEKSKPKEKEKSSGNKAENNIPMEKKISPTNKLTSNSKTDNKTKKSVQSKQSGFDNLFGKVSMKSKLSNKPKKNSDNGTQQNSLNPIQKEIIKKTDDDQEQDIEDKNQIKEKLKSLSETNTNHQNHLKFKNKIDTCGKKRNRSKENDTVSKRKRIVIASSSEDESNQSDNEDDQMETESEEILPKIIRKRSPSPVAEKRVNGKRMIRKTIDKNFKDEDGYLVTKRVHVYEVESDNDEPIKDRKEEPQKPKAVEVKAKKQMTLTNFFNKS